MRGGCNRQRWIDPGKYVVTLVRKIKKDNIMASIDWDLKNDAGIPIASGLYVIHVRTNIKCDITGKYVEKDKVIKWFGALRPIDLDTF